MIMKRMLIRWTQQHFWLRVLLSLPLSYGFWLVARPMGFEHTFFRGMATGLIAFAIVDLALTSGNEKRALLARLQALAQDNAVPLAKFVCGLSVLVLAMMLRTQPEEPFVQLVTSLVEVFGLLTVFLLPALSLLATNAWSRLPVWGLAPLIAWRLSAYAVALYLVGAFGDQTYQWVMANPTDSAALALALAISMLIRAAYAPRPVHVSPVGVASVSSAPLASRKPTARDHARTAAHEAGHALIYAALAEVPKDLRAVLDRNAEDGALGSVAGTVSVDMLEEQTLAEWWMLVCLAGKYGELVSFGTSSFGSESDHARWLAVARRYLGNHCRGIYYSLPQNKFEQELNDAKLAALQNEQLELLGAFFETNRSVLTDLADALLAQNTMDSSDLVPYLQRVRLPDGFPQPKDRIEPAHQ